jgi:hypothetical protein
MGNIARVCEDDIIDSIIAAATFGTDDTEDEVRCGCGAFITLTGFCWLPLVAVNRLGTLIMVATVCIKPNNNRIPLSLAFIKEEEEKGTQNLYIG